MTLCQGSVKPLSIDIAVKPVKTVKLSVDTLSDCQAMSTTEYNRILCATHPMARVDRSMWQSEAIQSPDKVMVYVLLNGLREKFGPFFIPPVHLS